MAFSTATETSPDTRLKLVRDEQLFMDMAAFSPQKIKFKEFKDTQPLALSETNGDLTPQTRDCSPVKPLTSIEMTGGFPWMISREVITPLGVALEAPAQAQNVREEFAVTEKLWP